MAIEIERKFLLRDDSWRAQVEHSQRMAQGYLVGTAGASQTAHPVLPCACASPASGVAQRQVGAAGHRAGRIRISAAVGRCQRPCWRSCATARLKKPAILFGSRAPCSRSTNFRRQRRPAGGRSRVAAADATFPRPAWLGREVSQLARYFNVNLIDHPYARWSHANVWRRMPHADDRPERYRTQCT